MRWSTPEDPLDETPATELERWPVEKRLARLEDNDRTTVVERRRIIALQRSQLRGVIACIALLVIVGTLYGRQINSNSHHAITAATKAELATAEARGAEKALRDSQIEGCKRGNERTLDENRSHLDDYHSFKLTASLLKLSLAFPPQANLTPQEQAQGRARAIAFIASLETYANRKTWKHPIPNCEKSVDHPHEYHLGPPIRFSEQLPPPSALVG